MESLRQKKRTIESRNAGDSRKGATQHQSRRPGFGSVTNDRVEKLKETKRKLEAPGSAGSARTGSYAKEYGSSSNRYSESRSRNAMHYTQNQYLSSGGYGRSGAYGTNHKISSSANSKVMELLQSHGDTKMHDISELISAPTNNRRVSSYHRNTLSKLEQIIPPS